MKKIILFSLFSVQIFALQTIKVGLFNVPPFSYKNEIGAIDGVTYKFLEKISKKSEIKFEYHLLPYQRLLNSLKDGSIDLAMFYPSDSYKENFKPLCETIGNDNLVILNEKITGKNLGDLKSKKIAILRGAKYSEEFENNSDISKILVNNYTQSISMLLAGRVDGIVIPKVALSYLLYTNKNLAGIKFPNSFVLNHKKNWIHVRSHFPEELKQKIIQANVDVINSNSYKELDDLSFYTTWQSHAISRFE